MLALALSDEAGGVRGNGAAWCRLQPFARDVVKGQQTMVPSRADTQRMVQSYYHVPRNLLVRFADDEVDETPDVSLWLQRAAEVDTILDLTILRRPGSHTRPLRQPLPELPEDVVNVASQVRVKSPHAGHGQNRTP
jgi:hypothetical protein